MREHGEAVGVAPVEIVDHQDESLPISQTREEISQRREGPMAELVRVERRLHLGELGDLRDAAERWEGLRQRRDARGDQAPQLALRQARQHARDRIYDVVESLVRDRLSLVATPRESEHVVAPRRDLLEEPPDSAALSNAGLPVKRDGDRLAVHDVVERALDLAELELAAHERGV